MRPRRRFARPSRSVNEIDAKIKEFLFCAGRGTDGCVPIPPDGFQLLVIAQNVLSIALVFFIGLALRNYFRIK